MLRNRTASGLIATVITASALAATPAATAASSVPTGPDIRRTFPQGDIHVDRGMVRPDAELLGASDLAGLRAVWTREELKVEVTTAGDPTVKKRVGGPYHAHNVFLADRSETRAPTVAMSWTEDGASFRRLGGAGQHPDVETCGASGTLTGSTVTYRMPSACFGEVTTLWVGVDLGWSEYTEAGDYLVARDAGAGRGALVAIVHQVGTSPSDERPVTGGSTSHHPVDRDPSPTRIELIDPRGDSSTESGTDITKAVVEARSDGTVKWTLETTGGLGDEDVSVSLYGTERWSNLTVRSYIGYGADAERITNGEYSEAEDYGRRACSATLDTIGTTIVLTSAEDCGAYERFDHVSLNLLHPRTSSYAGYAGDSVYGPVDLHRPTPTKPATKGRDVRATCEGRAAKTRFSDTGGNVHAAMIDCLSSYDITQGKGDGQYGAKDPLSRGQVATFLKKTLAAAGRTLPAGDGACSGKVHGDSLDAVVAARIMSSDGCDVTSRMTRADMAHATADAMTWAGKAPTGAPDYFHDDVWMRGGAQPKQNAIAHAGIVTGKAVGVFAPEDELRRDQMATFLARLLDALKA